MPNRTRHLQDAMASPLCYAKERCHYVEEDAIGPLWMGHRFSVSACLSGWTMLNGQTAVIEDVFNDARIPYDPYLPTFVKSLIMTPVGKKHVAATGACWSKKRQFSEFEIMTVETFGAIVGKALSDLLDRLGLLGA